MKKISRKIALNKQTVMTVTTKNSLIGGGATLGIQGCHADNDILGINSNVCSFFCDGKTIFCRSYANC